MVVRGNRTVGILVGGGPAPGINGVINAVTLAARARGWRVLGIPSGMSRLMKGDVSGVVELTEATVEPIATRGGVLLGTSRANPTKDPEALKKVVAALEELGVTDLVTIGGDDTATSAMRVARESGGRFRAVHVPKTIDNDLPLPANAPTFGFETAKDVGAKIARSLAEDARATDRFYLMTVMGRTAGHLAISVGIASGAILTIIAEEFPPGPIRLEQLADLVEGTILKRLAAGQSHGLVILAEGTLDRMDPAELATFTTIERDEHGHPRLSEISLGKVVREILAERFAARDLKVGFIAKELGYELRSADPIAFDVQYTRTLGFGAVEFLASGGTDSLISFVDGKLAPLTFDSLRDPATGKVRVRNVDPRGDAWKASLALQARITPADIADGWAKLANVSREEAATLSRRLDWTVNR
ncbi:MAG: 6-phosphofructokinase [Thermoplasmatota archaeon]